MARGGTGESVESTGIRNQGAEDVGSHVVHGEDSSPAPEPECCREKALGKGRSRTGSMADLEGLSSDCFCMGVPHLAQLS